MKLSRVRITEFQSVYDSTEFEIGDITCLVGKNEAGKTALLQALYRLNPIIDRDGSYSVTDDYPRSTVSDYENETESGARPSATVVHATFDLDAQDLQAIENVFGPKALDGRFLELSKGYDNKVSYKLPINELTALRFLIAEKQFTPDVTPKLKDCGSVEKALEVLSTVEQTEAARQLTSLLQKIQGQGGIAAHSYEEILKPRVPKFLYFDEYYQIRGHANLNALIERQKQGGLLPSDHPLLGLIKLARLNPGDLLNPPRTRELMNKLEGAGNQLTRRIIKYWSQNRYLQLRFDVRPALQGDPEGMQQGTNIWGEVYDQKHMVTTELGTRSRGFVWFFSFLAWYSDLSEHEKDVILLLDEPGLSLHAKAQEDLLGFFEAEIKGKNQLIYTTHSPFMVDPAHFDRVRIVQDRSIETDGDLPTEDQGTKVLTDVLIATPDSLFPLQGALGYEIYQTLFIGPNSLVVEGVSDLLFIQTMSAVLQRNGRTGLSPSWTITPVGGSDKVPTFVALIGAQKNLNVAVLIDFQKKDKQVIENLYVRKLLTRQHVLTFADFVSAAEADIEDMFDRDFYLKLVNEEFANDLTKSIQQSDLNNNMPRVLMRVEEYIKANPLKAGVAFNHYRPARYFAEKIAALTCEISSATLDRFERAFKMANALLPE